MRIDFTVVLFWASLGLSAAAVIVFLWLMRDHEAGGVRRKAEGEVGEPETNPDPPESPRLTPRA